MLVGAAFVIAPGLAGRAWIGGEAARRPVKVLARAFGVRDFVLGAGVATALDRHAELRSWIQAAIVSDGVDTCASALAGSSIHPLVRWPCIALGASSTALGARLLGELDASARRRSGNP